VKKAHRKRVPQQEAENDIPETVRIERNKNPRSSLIHRESRREDKGGLNAKKKVTRTFSEKAT